MRCSCLRTVHVKGQIVQEGCHQLGSERCFSMGVEGRTSQMVSWDILADSCCSNVAFSTGFDDVFGE